MYLWEWVNLLMNYNNLIKSIEKISSDKGLNMSQKRIVVSTSGIPKMIKKLADEDLRVNLHYLFTLQLRKLEIL